MKKSAPSELRSMQCGFNMAGFVFSQHGRWILCIIFWIFLHLKVWQPWLMLPSWKVPLHSFLSPNWMYLFINCCILGSRVNLPINMKQKTQLQSRGRNWWPNFSARSLFEGLFLRCIQRAFVCVWVCQREAKYPGSHWVEWFLSSSLLFFM